MYIGLHVQYRYLCQILLELEFSRQIFEKYSNDKFHENPSSGSRVVRCGRTDRHDEANGSSPQICERVSESVYNCTCLVRGQHVVPHSKQLSRGADIMALRETYAPKIKGRKGGETCVRKYFKIWAPKYCEMTQRGHHVGERPVKRSCG